MKNILLLVLLFNIQFFGVAQTNYVPNQIIVMMNGKQSIKTVLEEYNTTYTKLNIQNIRTLSNRAHIYLLEFDPAQIIIKDLIAQLKTDERIALAQHNHTDIKQRSTVPNDLEYPVQWSVGSTATARIFAPEAWDISTDGITANGDTIVMAVVDGGVDLVHIDLNFYKNKHEIPNNGIDDDNNGYVDDYDGWNAYTQSGQITSDDHGTHIAGTIGAKTNNTEGVAGIVWGGAILPILASSNLESVVIEGYGYALELRAKYNETNGDSGAFVVATNSSFGVDMADPANYPIWCAFYDSLGAEGILNMGATTNQGLNVDVVGDVPTTCPSNYMIAVANTNKNGSILGGYGPTQVDLAAPGTDIRSTIPGHQYGYKTGTSMATPHVVGVVGAMYSAMCGFDQSVFFTHPDSIALWVRQSLLEAVDSVPNLIGKTATNGRLNMFKALQKMETVSVDLNHSISLPTDNNSFNGTIATTPSGGTPPYSYLWGSGETTNTITLIGPGDYEVLVTEAYGCTITDTVSVWTVGINEIKSTSNFQISPNPNQGTFQLRFGNLSTEIATIQIYDGVGRMVYQKEFNPINGLFELQTNLQPGMYFARVNFEDTQVLIVK